MRQNELTNQWENPSTDVLWGWLACVVPSSVV